MPSLEPPFRPTRAELEAARALTVPDVVGPGLRVLFCGINPGLYTAAIGHHFGRPGNRFWPALHRSGFTPRQLAPWEEGELLALGLGITNLVGRTTAVASELSPAELREGGSLLVARLEEYRPGWLAMLGLGSYRAAFGRPAAALGHQPGRLGPSRVWLLPNPSGLNAHYQLDALATEFGRLRDAI
ncbi:MAG TPA: G/U mismatch-specific DNA glycosylase [Candidatus Dormibacteraeota bacterium]